MARLPEIMFAMHKYCNEIHPYQDGFSRELALAAADKLIDNRIADIKLKPLNLLRNLKTRKKVKILEVVAFLMWVFSGLS